MGAWKGENHIFHYEGRTVLYNVANGAFFEASECVRDIFACHDVNNREEVVAALSGTHTFEEVVGALDELEAMDVVSFAPSLSPADSPEDVTAAGRASGPPTPISITLHVAHACNITCTYCFALGGSYGGKKEMMAPETARQAVDWLMDQSREAGRCKIDFFGGEPLLNLDLVKETVAYARAEGARREIEPEFSITTNGTLLSGDALAFLMSEDIGVMVSVDGDKASHDATRTFHDGSPTYDAITENVIQAAARRPDLLDVRATVTNRNLDFADVASNLEHLGTDLLGISPSMESPYSPTAIRQEHVPELKRQLRKVSRRELERMMGGLENANPQFAARIKQVLNPGTRTHGCGAGKNYFGVNVDGGLLFCSTFGSMGDDYRLGDVWNGLNEEKQRELDERFHVDNRSVCRTCWARNLCGGGCVYDAQVATGEARNPNPVSCERIRYTYELAMGMALELSEENPALFEQLVNDAS